MPLSFSLFLAVKYMKPKRSLLSVISVISVIGVMLGVAVLVIVISVMSGFDDMWREKILGFDAHVTLLRNGPIGDPARLAEQVRQAEGVTAVAPYVQGLVFVQHDRALYTPMMRGIDVEQERLVSRLPKNMWAGTFDLSENDALVGRELARRLGVDVGSTLLIYSPHSFIAGKDEIGLPEEVTVAGIFEVGMWEYDIGFIFLPMALARQLYGMEKGVHALRVMTQDPFQAPVVAQRLVERLEGEYPDLRAQTWMDLNRQLFDALRVEKNMMFFLLIFIVLVAAFGITNTLIIVVVRKTKEIGLLKALGFTSGSIMRIFLWQGWVQGLVGTALGIGLGLLALHYRNVLMHGLSSLLGMNLFPAALYHLSEIPARTSTGDVAMIAALSITICTLSGLLPAWRAARLDPARSLRYE